MPGKGLVIGAGVGLVAIFGGANAFFQYGTVEQERFTVVDAYEVTQGETREKRIQVITEEGCTETYRVEDSFWHGQFYSSNLHGVFADAVTSEGREDNVFEVSHYGWRNGFFSMMENVYEAERLENVAPFTVRRDATAACRL